MSLTEENAGRGEKKAKWGHKKKRKNGEAYEYRNEEI